MQLLLLLLSLLVHSNAISATSKRSSTTEFVKDGGFERVTSDSEFTPYNFTSGHWTFKKEATYETNEFEHFTPYGKQLAVVSNKRFIDLSGTIAQHIKGLSTAATYNLTFAYRIENPDYNTGCYWNVTLGSQLIHSVYLPPTPQSHLDEPWQTTTQSFTPTISSGRLMFELACIQRQMHHWEFFLDDISLTGPSS